MSTACKSISDPEADPESDPTAMTRPGRSYYLGRIDYLEAARIQHALMQERLQGRRPDTFLFVEHAPLISLGRGAHREHLLAGEEALRAAGAEVWASTRGGDVTYHGPGQLVGYGILDLRQHGRDLGRYLRQLEEALIGVLADYGFQGSRREGMTGAWVGDRKVAAIGVRVDRWVTAHGFALNIDPDLSHYEWIVPCGIRDFGVTSLAQLMRESDPAAAIPPLPEVAERARLRLGEVFGVDFDPGEADELEKLELPSEPPLGGVNRQFPTPEKS